MTAPPSPPYGADGPYGAPPPENHLVWGILTTLLCCLPLGIVSIVKASQVHNLWAQGHHQAAQKAAEDAKKFAIWAAGAGVAVILIYVIFMIFLVAGSNTYY